jgi:very-short-patch-repair endonuclease
LFAEELFRQLASNPLPLTIQPQAPVGPYFADFLLSLDGKSVAVECDGKDFHSTPAQVEHDRKRDEFFLRRGIKTARFSGSAIHNDASGCAREALELLGPEYEYEPPSREAIAEYDAQCRALSEARRLREESEKQEQERRWLEAKRRLAEYARGTSK